MLTPAETKRQKIQNFDPDAVGKTNGNLFGLPFTPDECEVVIIPVPWEATVSYRAGTADAPEAILNASPQLDLFDPEIPNAWHLGMGMLHIPADWVETNLLTRKRSRACIELLEQGVELDNAAIKQFAEPTNQVCINLKNWVRETALEWIKKGKIVGVLGGEHSSPLGLMEAIGEVYGDFGILQIDAHADLRDSYMGFQYSHASIMFNALKNDKISKLVQVGVRDFCRSEAELIRNSNSRIILYEDRVLKNRQFNGSNWRELCEEVVSHLPNHVYVSYDIDGLEPSLCPNTGTPVPGGLRYEEACFLIETVVRSGRKIIGFDLCEVCSGDEESIDPMVGARVLYHLGNRAALSQGRFETL